MQQSRRLSLPTKIIRRCSFDLFSENVCFYFLRHAFPKDGRKWDRRTEFFHIFSQVKVAERWVIFGALRSVQIRPDMEFENIAFFRSIQHQTIGIPCELSIRVNYRLFSPIPEAAKAKIIFSDCRFPRNVTSGILRLRWMLWGTLKYRDSSLDREC